MPLVYGVISPHPPILIPTIGGENLKQIKKTADSLKELEGELYASQPDTTLIISPHGPIAADNFLINIANDFHSNLEQFGDFTTKLHYQGDLEMATLIKEAVEDKSISINLINEPSLDHGVTVPLYYLSQHLKKIKIVPISYSLLDLKNHLTFGQIIGHEIVKTNKRVAVIASGDLSHCLTEGAPAGFNPSGKKFDQTMIKLIENNNLDGLLHLDHQLIEEAGECGLRSIAILFGIFHHLQYQTKVLSYEGPFGVGYMVANFTLK